MARFQYKKKMISRPDREKLCKYYAKDRIDGMIRQAFQSLEQREECRNTFRQLLVSIQNDTALLKPIPGNFRWAEISLYIHGLKNLALQTHKFIRPLHSWMPPDGNSRQIFTSLVQHLLLKYQTPDFMFSVWLQPVSESAKNQQMWHIGMSRGLSIRRMNVSFRMTRRMESIFLHAPAHFTVEEAMRYSQILGLGGDRNLAKAILATHLGREFAHEEFWEKVIHFFINNQNMNLDFVNPIVDFLNHMKFVKREVVADDRTIVMNPPRPDLSIKGRSFNSIMRMVNLWHKETSRSKNIPSVSWRKSSIREFVNLEEIHGSDGNRRQRIWSISQLLSAAQLHDEGRKMGHCAGSYYMSCYRGKTTVWSMKLEAAEFIKRVMTIEVDPHSRIIRQARAKYNRRPKNASMNILKKWAAKENLTFSQYL